MLNKLQLWRPEMLYNDAQIARWHLVYTHLRTFTYEPYCSYLYFEAITWVNILRMAFLHPALLQAGN